MIEIEKIHTMILESIKNYVTRNVRFLSIREILQSLTSKFKKSSKEIQRQINRRYEKLRNFYSMKNKIEFWICKWEFLREEIVVLDVELMYSEYIYIQHFLKAVRIWAFFFCDIWMKIRKTFDQLLKFFEIVNEYRTELKENSMNQSTRRDQHSTNSTSLQN